MCWAERRELKQFACTNRTLEFDVGDIPSSQMYGRTSIQQSTYLQGYIVPARIPGDEDLT